jgi:predicted Zn-dependent protease
MTMKMRNLVTLLCCLLIPAVQANDLEKALQQWLKGGSQPSGQTGQQAMAPPPQPPAQEQAPSPGDQMLRALLAGQTSQEDELRIGQQIAGNLLGVAPLVNDPALQRYVNQVGRWVALQSERPDLAWRFGVVESEDINAFAAPGGYVLLTKGLYRRLDNEAELAGVLAHEIGHVVRKHHLELLRQTQMISALGGLLGRKLKGESQLVQNVIGNGAEIVARGLDKEAEHEADRIGMVLAARAGYDAYGLPTVLQEIGHLSATDGRVALLYKTHPHPDERFNRLAEAVGTRLDDLPPGQTVANRFYRLR